MSFIQSNQLGMISQQIAPYFQTLVQTGLEPFRAFGRRKCVSHNVTGGLRNARLAKSCPILSICDLRARLARLSGQRAVSALRSSAIATFPGKPEKSAAVKTRQLISLRYALDFWTDRENNI